ncbi:MAG: peptidylprolyl isomerase [Idiomarina sp.]
MLERIREGSQSMVVKVILVFIIVTFAFTGVSGYLGSTSEPGVAVVNGETITQTEYDRAYQNERARMEEQLGDMFAQLTSDPRYMRQMRANVVEQLIEQELVAQYAREQGLRVSDEQVKEAIRNISAFRSAGQFSNDVYLMALRNSGYNPESFAQAMRGDMARTQLVRTLIESDFSLPGEATRLQSILAQTRSGRYLQVTLQDYMGDVAVEDEEIQAYYDNNRAQFATEERVKVEYVRLDYDAIAGDISIADETVRDYYDNNLSRYTTEEQRRVSHILIETGDDAEAARQEIEQVQQQLEQGTEFAELAAEFSDDVFSGEQGGDLEWISSGQMDPEFEEAVFGLEETGDISGIVETSFGYHLIKLTDVRAGEVQEFAEVEAEIRDQMQRQQAEEAYFMAQQQLAETSFEIPDSLAPAAEETSQELVQTDWFTESTVPADLNVPQVVAQVFSSDLVDEKLASDIIELDDQSAVVVRVVDHEPASTQPLAEVRDTVTQLLQEEKAQRQAVLAADEFAAQLRAGEIADTSMMTTIDSITRQSQDVPVAVREALFELPPVTGDEASMKTVTLRSGDVAVVQLTEVTPGEENADQVAELQQQMEQRHAQVLYQAFIESLRAQADIERENNPTETTQ